MKSFLLTIPSAVLLLAACASPLEQCLSDAESDFRAMSRLKAETSMNIARGYAVHRQTVPYQYTGSCYDYYIGNYSCPKTGYRTQESPVPIDVRQERQKLAEINVALQRLEDQSRAATQQCRATYPE